MKLPTHWITRDKRAIPIVEMSDSHLANALALVQRNIKNTMDAHDACYGHGFQGEMACYYAEQEASVTENQLLKLRLAEKALSAEQQRRMRPDPQSQDSDGIIEHCMEQGILTENEIQEAAKYRQSMRQYARDNAHRLPICASYLALRDSHPMARYLDDNEDYSNDPSDLGDPPF